MNFTELLLKLMNKPYYKVTVVNDMEVIKTIIQPAIDKRKGYDIAIIDKKMHKAWWKIDGICFRDKKKFLMTCDINNAIPLIEHKKVVTSGDLIIKEITMGQLVEQNADLRNIESGRGKKFLKIEYPPTVLFEELEGCFITDILAEPPNKLSEFKDVAIVFILVFGAIAAYYLFTHGAI